MPPIASPKTSSRRGGSVLIAAISGRALARAAVEAGYTPLVADFFADQDAQRLAPACRKMPGAIADGFQWDHLEPALADLARDAPSPVRGVVYGAGFEDRPNLLTYISERWPLLGNDADTVARIKNPDVFFQALAALHIPHPATTTAPPASRAGWITKRAGSAGGSHISATAPGMHATGTYYQELLPGRAVSALFVANGTAAQVLGFSEQWTAPAPGKPWRYGGAVRPAPLPEAAAAGMADAVAAIAEAFPLKGLGSADFVLAGKSFSLLEINPRPGATLDIYEGTGTPLLGLHVDATELGALPATQPKIEGAAAAAIVFALARIIVPRDMVWPDWAADVPKPGERIDKQRPICTVLARANSGSSAKQLAKTRECAVLAKIKKHCSSFGGDDNREQEQD